MSFRIGQPVWIGWAPDRYVPENARPYRCTAGTIDAGPFPPFARISGYGLCKEASWLVNVHGTVILVSERILFPIDDDDHSVTTERECEVPA